MVINKKIQVMKTRWSALTGGKRLLLALLIILMASALVETFVFNISYFTTLSNTPVSLKSLCETDASGNIYVTPDNNTILLTGIDTNTENVYIKPVDGKYYSFTLKVSLQDAGNESLYDLSPTDVNTSVPKSTYITLHPDGVTNSLQLTFSDMNGYPISLDDIIINANIPFQFNLTRMLTFACIVFALFLFRPKSSIYKRLLSEKGMIKRLFIYALVISSISIVTLGLLDNHSISISTSTYNSDGWDGTSIVNISNIVDHHERQYAMLAESFANGDLYLSETVPDWLVEMDNPYDTGARNTLAEATGVDDPTNAYFWDAAYYQGHYYVYFGVLPVLIFYLPFYLLTGAALPTAVVAFICLELLIAGLMALLYRIARLWFPKASVGVYLLLCAGIYISSGSMYVQWYASMYTVPNTMALALTIWGLYFWLTGLNSKRQTTCFAVGSTCMALVLATRPQFLLYSLFGLPLFWAVFIKGRPRFTRISARNLIVLLAPYLVVACGVGWYNYARFGSVTNFGSTYNLTTNDLTNRGFYLARIPLGIFSYLLQPWRVTSVFPFVVPADITNTYLGQTYSEHTYGGIIACAPFIWILLFIKPILKQKKNVLVTCFVVLSLILGTLIAGLDAEVGGLLYRYTLDFAALFGFAAALLILCVEEQFSSGRSRERFIYLLDIAMLITGAYYLLTFFSEAFVRLPWMNNTLYVAILQGIQFWL